MKSLVFCLLFIYSVNCVSQSKWHQQIQSEISQCEESYGKLSKENREYFLELFEYHYEDFEKDNSTDSSMFQNYLSDLVKKIEPDYRHFDKIFLEKSPYPNASCRFLGDIRINWGLVADLEDEASLSATIGHEIGHYQFKHTYRSFFREVERKFSNRDTVILDYHISQSFEASCDSLGFYLIQKAGYSPKGVEEKFKEYISLDSIFSFLETKAKVYDSKGVLKQISIDSIFITHPLTSNRIKKWRSYSEGSSQKGSSFLVSEEKFKKLRSYCREKVLEELLMRGNYDYGMIKAFKYYYLENKSDKYKYYLLEFIRRRIGKNNTLKEKIIFSDVFKDKRDKGVLTYLDWIFRNSDYHKEVKELVKSEVQETSSYNDFLSNIGFSKPNSSKPEYYLSLAMIYHDDDSLKNIFLTKYLNKDSISFRSFAECYKTNSLARKLAMNKKKLVVFDSFSFLKYSRKGITNQYAKSNLFYKKYGDRLSRDINKIKSDYKIEFKYWNNNSVIKEGFKDTVYNYLISELYYKSRSASKGFQNSQLKYLDNPELWTYMYQNGYSEIQVYKTTRILNKRVSAPVNGFNRFLLISERVFNPLNPYQSGIFSSFNHRNLFHVQKYSIKSNKMEVEENETLVYSKFTYNKMFSEIILELHE